MANKILGGDHDVFSMAPWRAIKFDPTQISSGTDLTWKWPAGRDVQAYPYVGWNGLEGVQVHNLLWLNVSFNKPRAEPASPTSPSTPGSPTIPATRGRPAAKSWSP